MKRIPNHCRRSGYSGFTLVELLVVMGIIAILASVILYAGGTAIRAAKRVKAANMANQIQTAALNYYTEYSVYPVPSTATASTDFYASDSDTTSWPIIIEALCGNQSPHNGTSGLTGLTVTNTRAIAFLQLKPTDVDSHDCPVNPLPISTTANPYFNIGMDYDYSGIIGDSGTAPSPGMPNFTTSAQGAMTYYASPKGVSGGVVVWANCNTSTTAALWNPNFYVHTY
jgi:prepilin-type N-terminal cleavage/methylation domain-containing protein